MTDIILANQGKNILSEDFVRWSLYQVACGLLAMHREKILHRDIKSDNILCRPDGTIKIADMGFSVFLSEQKQSRESRKGTPSWVSPEIAKGVNYTKEVDVWAYGCFAYELLNGEPPHHHRLDFGLQQLLDAIINEDVPPIDESRWSANMQDFVQKCLIRDP